MDLSLILQVQVLKLKNFKDSVSPCLTCRTNFLLKCVDRESRRTHARQYMFWGEICHRKSILTFLFILRYFNICSKGISQVRFWKIVCCKQKKCFVSKLHVCSLARHYNVVKSLKIVSFFLDSAAIRYSIIQKKNQQWIVFCFPLDDVKDTQCLTCMQRCLCFLSS